MRIGRGCERCRLRHIRCTVTKGAPSCTECARLSRPCHLDPLFRFKAVHHVYQKRRGTASKFELAWDPLQTWVGIPKCLTFVQDSAEEEEGDSPPESQSENPPSSVTTSRRVSNTFLATQQSEPFNLLKNTRIPRSIPPRASTGCTFAEQRNSSMSTSTISPQTASAVSPIPSARTSEEVSSMSSLSTRPSAQPYMTSREAFLLRLFIHRISPWIDVCDVNSHFSTEVPRRALQIPMMLKAILALAARHDAIMSEASDWEASEYHGQCLEYLIAALAQPEETYDDNLLITVVILRIYEELERTTDEKCHWLGSNRLLNTMSRSASSGGLAEAVSWQFLRQAIYASLVQHQPMQLNLENYERSSVFQRSDDAAYANNIIFLCARVIQLCSGSQARTVSKSDWNYLSESVERWHQARPISWQPLKYKDANPTENNPFPELWMMSPASVVGLQYYHTAHVILTSTNRHWGVTNDYELARLKRLEEKTISSHIVEVIGLSKSNKTVENAYFMACHLLHRYGYCLRHLVEQQASLEFLSHVEKTIGWRTQWIVRELQDQWIELRNLDSWGH